MFICSDSKQNNAYLLVHLTSHPYACRTDIFGRDSPITNFNWQSRVTWCYICWWWWTCSVHRTRSWTFIPSEAILAQQGGQTKAIRKESGKGKGKLQIKDDVPASIVQGWLNLWWHLQNHVSRKAKASKAGRWLKAQQPRQTDKSWKKTQSYKRESKYAIASCIWIILLADRVLSSLSLTLIVTLSCTLHAASYVSIIPTAITPFMIFFCVWEPCQSWSHGLLPFCICQMPAATTTNHSIP